jgi:hypothetical protein
MYEREKYPTGLVIFMTAIKAYTRFLSHYRVSSVHIIQVLGDTCASEVNLFRLGAAEMGIAIEDLTNIPALSLPKNSSDPSWQKLSGSKSNAFYVLETHDSNHSFV